MATRLLQSHLQKKSKLWNSHSPILLSTEFNGARQHLKLAAERATAGEWADCIRESVNSVEATVRCIDANAKDLRPALATLEKQGTVQGSLKEGFLKLLRQRRKGLTALTGFSGSCKGGPDRCAIHAWSVCGVCFVSDQQGQSSGIDQRVIARRCLSAVYSSCLPCRAKYSNSAKTIARPKPIAINAVLSSMM